MASEKKWNVLFIKDDRSGFDAGTPAFEKLFNSVDVVQDKASVLKLFGERTYEIVIGDLSVEPEAAGLLKQLKDMKKTQAIFAMVSPKDTDKLFGIADLGIHAFELTPDHFDLALEQIAQFDPFAQ